MLVGSQAVPADHEMAGLCVQVAGMLHAAGAVPGPARDAAVCLRFSDSVAGSCWPTAVECRREPQPSTTKEVMPIHK